MARPSLEKVGESRAASSAWTPFELLWDDAPLDLSHLYAAERPAGKHGFLQRDGSCFVFEDGTPARFWGVNFNGGANFPEHKESEQIARRLAKFGVNLVRAHQLDADWSTPNLFQFNRTEPLSSTRALDERSLSRVDYLIACLKEQGIYVYLDLLTYRRFLPGDDVDRACELAAAARPYCLFDRRLIELQKEFNEQLWTHPNPYTGLRYCDDPVIVLTELVNECSFDMFPPTLQPYRRDLASLYREWAAGQDLTIDSDPDFDKPTAQLAAFFAHVERAYYRELAGHLREIGVRVPITGTTGTGTEFSMTTLGLLESQQETDFTDTHLYWNFPRWEAPESSGPSPTGLHRPMVTDARPAYPYALAFRAIDRPLFISEWDHAWPDEWRAESPIAYAAIGAFQDWAGFAVHAYRYATHGPVDRIGGGSSTIDGNPYRNGHFDTFNDPAKFGLFYQAALLFRRCDVQIGRDQAVVKIEDDENWRLFTVDDLPVLDSLGELHRAGIAIPPDRPHPGQHVLSRDGASVNAASEELIADTGELGRNRADGIGWIDTPRTKAAYGFIGRRNRIQLHDFDIAAMTDFATIALSSLTEDPISESPLLLLTAVGRCDNTGTAYNDMRTRQLDYGHGPVLIEAVEADIAIRTTRLDLTVWVVGIRGEAIARLPVEYKEGRLAFSIGPRPVHEQSTIYYLIRA
jgi:hypothetical protein